MPAKGRGFSEGSRHPNPAINDPVTDKNPPGALLRGDLLIIYGICRASLIEPGAWNWFGSLVVRWARLGRERGQRAGPHRPRPAGTAARPPITEEWPSD